MMWIIILAQIFLGIICLAIQSRLYKFPTITENPFKFYKNDLNKYKVKYSIWQYGIFILVTIIPILGILINLTYIINTGIDLNSDYSGYYLKGFKGRFFDFLNKKY